MNALALIDSSETNKANWWGVGTPRYPLPVGLIEPSETNKVNWRGVDAPNSYAIIAHEMEMFCEETISSATSSNGYLVSYLGENTTAENLLWASFRKKRASFNWSAELERYFTEPSPHIFLVDASWSLQPPDSGTEQQCHPRFLSCYLARSAFQKAQGQSVVEKNAGAINLLTQWLRNANKDEMDEQQQSLSATKAGIDDHRSSDRKLYP